MFHENNHELYEKLARLQWLLRRRHMHGHAKRGPAADSSCGQGRVLAMLNLQPEISAKDLSFLLGIRQQSLNELLNKLEKRGYITRTPSESDRRILLVHLTEAGKNQVQADSDRPAQEDIFGCLSAEEQAAFGEYLDRVIAALEEQPCAGEEDGMDGWMDDIRARMGDEKFERLMEMRGGFPPHRHGNGCGAGPLRGGCHAGSASDADIFQDRGGRKNRSCSPPVNSERPDQE